MINKKAQGGAAGIIAIIAGLIVLYILLLPQGAREELLNQSSSSTSTNSKGTSIEHISLVLEHPGTLDPVTNTDREKILDSFSLYSEESALVLKSVDAVRLERGWLRTKVYNLTFKVSDLSNTKNYVLAFDADKALGNLEVSLNGKEVYNAQITPGNTNPINLPADEINDQNSIILSVAPVGLAFWRLNEYDLRNVRVIAEFTDVSKREYNNFFIISATEKENFEKTRLSFVPNCLTDKVGPLVVKINNHDLKYSAIPDCGLLSTLEFDSAILKQGENVISFSATQGNYFVDRVSIKADLKDLNHPFYYFELKPVEFRNITAGRSNVTLELRFADLDRKVGEINVNGHLSSLDTYNGTYVKYIDTFVEENQNYIQIVPKSVLNIVDLSVILTK